MRIAAALVAVTALAAGTAVAVADEPDEPDEPDTSEVDAARARAQALADEGFARAQAGDHLGALGKYRAALAAYESPNLHVYIGSALWNLGRYAEAMTSYETYLAHPAAEPARAAQVEEFLAELDRIVARIIVRPDPDDATVTIDGDEAEAGAAHRRDPGRHTVVVAAAGHVTATRVIALARGATAEIEIALAAVEPEVRVVRAPAPQEGEIDAPRAPPRGRLAVRADAVVDVAGPGAAFAPGVSFAVLGSGSLELDGAALLGPEQGVYLGLTYFLGRGRVRGTFAAGAPIFVSDGFDPAIRGGAGIEVDLGRELGLVVEAGVEYYPRAPRDRVDVLFAPVAGLFTRL